MSARDRFHDAVKIALQKDGWTITADPLFFRFGGVDVYIDLAAERIIAAERNGEAIADVEVLDCDLNVGFRRCGLRERIVWNIRCRYRATTTDEGQST